MDPRAPARGPGRPRVVGAPAGAPAPPAHVEPSAKRVAVVSDEQLLAMKPLKPRKRATFEAPTPSNYCHICSRTPNRGIKLAVCAALREGLCRKVVCERCFGEYALGCSFEDAASKAVEWKCVHCQGICPERAQCRTYQNVNRKLRLQRLRQSVGPVESAAGTATVAAATVAAGTAASAHPPRQRPHQHRKKKQQVNADTMKGPARVHAQQTLVYPAAQATEVYSSGQRAASAYAPTPSHVYAALQPPRGYADAHISVDPSRDSARGPIHSTSNANTQRYDASAAYDKFPKASSPKSVAAREPYVLESSEAQQPQAERGYIMHTAVSTTSQDRGQLHRQIASAPRRTYRVCSTITKPGPILGATHKLNTTAENLCHLCKARQTEASQTFTNCSAAMNTGCRKTFCDRCMEKNALRDSKVASEARGERWNCSHCTDMCPSEAACYQGGACAVSSDAREVSVDTHQAKTGGGMSLKRRLLAAATVGE